MNHPYLMNDLVDIKVESSYLMNGLVDIKVESSLSDEWFGGH